MAEEQAPNFQGMPQSARTKKYNKLYDTLTSQTVGDRSFTDMYGALQEGEVGAYKEKTGWPYIFTGASKKSSAFGPLQITYSTALDYFYPGDSETEKRDNMKAGNFKEGYTQLPNDVKGYIKGFIEQGINKRNRKGGVYGSYGVGDISAKDHKKHYPFLAAVHVNEKKKLADADTVPAFVNAHFGDIQEDDPQKENKERQLANLQTKVSDTLGVTVRPVTTDVAEGFSEPVTVTPEPQPAPEPAPVAPETKTQTDEAFTLDYEGELPDIGDDVPMPDLPATDVAPDTTDAIPPAMVDVPEDKNIFERAYDYMFGGDDTPEEIQEREQTRQRLLQSLEMNEGGMAIEKQMEMFEDGGLMDEGGTVDPVSGNDVPPGSTQEEVRDDIPAQLSEGEFVFPADVVRYIGLEKLMQMRQEAKAGLARMEAMGQMGNSEEAVLPDDIPFDLDDLDMEDEPMEFQQGGLVPNPYGVYQQPSQFATYGQQQYQAPQIPTAPMAPQAPLQTGFQPVTTPVQTTAVPTFEQVMPTTTGKYDELREYVNEETGQTMTIPFVDGKPIYPIPQGFTPKPTEQVEAAVPETTVPTAQVAPVSGDGDERRRAEEEAMYGPGGGRFGVGGKIYGVSFDTPEGFLPSVMGTGATALSLATGKPLPEQATVKFKRGDTEFILSASEYNSLKAVAESEGYNSDAAKTKFKEIRDQALEKKAEKERVEAEAARKAKLEAAAKAAAAATEAARKAAEEEQRRQEQIEQERLRQLSETNINRLYGDSDDRDESQQRAAERQREADSFTREAVRDVEERISSGRGFAEGGLADKPKTKKMKQGGMASKK